MIDIDFINSFIKDLAINSFIFYIFIKIINYKELTNKKIIIVLALNAIISCLYSFLLQYVNFFITNIICISLYSIIISYVIKKEIGYTSIVMLLSTALTFCFFVFSSIISSVIFNVLLRHLNYNNPIGIFLIITMESLLIYSLFKIKRFKNGFSFIKNENYINSISIFGMICSGVAITIYAFIGIEKDIKTNQILYVGIILSIFGLIIWTKRQISLLYKESLKEDTILQLEKELKEEKIKNEKATKEIEKLATINHKYSTRISATEAFVKEVCKKYNSEFSKEISEATELIDTLSREYSDELVLKSKHIIDRPKTNNTGIDALISFLKKEAEKSNIKLIYEVNYDIINLTKAIIQQSKLETLLGDHIKDAIIAIKVSENKYKNIKLIFDINNNNYEIKIYDSGKEFEIETLLKLGLEPVTTHRDTGGSGIGFMTTFETLEECKGSLIIEETHKIIDNDFTKAVIIRFDGKNEYKIRSYRADEIRKQINDNRIIIEDL